MVRSVSRENTLLDDDDQDERTILATYDILESIFGKYKHFSQRCPLSDLRSMLLTIPLSTLKLTRDVIKQALETVRGIDLSVASAVPQCTSDPQDSNIQLILLNETEVNIDS